jgi:hypothetical protein
METDCQSSQLPDRQQAVGLERHDIGPAEQARSFAPEKPEFCYIDNRDS